MHTGAITAVMRRSCQAAAVCQAAVACQTVAAVVEAAAAAIRPQTAFFFIANYHGHNGRTSRKIWLVDRRIGVIRSKCEEN